MITTSWRRMVYVLSCNRWRRTNTILLVAVTCNIPLIESLNKGKTEILASFGSVARYPAYLSEFSKDTIKFLGVQFSINQFRELSAINWNRILEKAQSRVESYKKRRLSMPGKILLLNVAVFPLFFTWQVLLCHQNQLLTRC